MDLRRSINGIKVFWKHNSRAILTTGSVILGVSAVVEAIRATSLAKDLIDEAEYDKFESLGCPEDESIDYRLTKGEIFKHTWKCYIWTTLLLSGSIACGIASHVESNKKLNAAAIAYGGLLETYNTYKENVEKVVKEKDLREINHRTVHDIVERDKEAMSDQIKDQMFKDNGEDILVLFRDAYSSKGASGYFKLTSEDVRKAELDFNKKLMDDGVATLNDWYDCLDIGHSEVGDYYGWRYDPNGPLFAVTIPDDFNISNDIRSVTCLGLGYTRYSRFFERPKSLY